MYLYSHRWQKLITRYYKYHSLHTTTQMYSHFLLMMWWNNISQFRVHRWHSWVDIKYGWLQPEIHRMKPSSKRCKKGGRWEQRGRRPSPRTVILEIRANMKAHVLVNGVREAGLRVQSNFSRFHDHHIHRNQKREQVIVPFWPLKVVDVLYL